MVKEIALMNDKISKKLFIGDEVGKELSALVISEVLDLDYEDVYSNLEYEHPNSSNNINIVINTGVLLLSSCLF